MPKGFTEDGRPILTQEEFVEQCEHYLEMKKGKQSNPKEMPKKETKKKPNNVKQTTTKKSNSVFDTIVNMLQSKSEFSNISIEKTTISLSQKSDTYEIKWQSKREPFEIGEYNGTKDATKNKIIKYICDVETDYTIIPIDKTGLIGVVDNSSYYTIKITKKRA